MLPMSWATTAVLSYPSPVTTARMSSACVFLSYPPAGFDDRPIPRRSGTTTVWFVHEICGQRSPRVAVFGVSVEKHDHRSGSSPAHEDVGPFGAVNGLCLKAGGQRRLCAKESCRKAENCNGQKVSDHVEIFHGGRVAYL